MVTTEEQMEFVEQDAQQMKNGKETSAFVVVVLLDTEHAKNALQDHSRTQIEPNVFAAVLINTSQPIDLSVLPVL